MMRRLLGTIRDAVLGACGWMSVRVIGSRRSIVLAYHSISHADWIHAVHPTEFKKQMLWLKLACDVVDLEEVERRQSAPTRSRRLVAAITFDDGYIDWIQHAAPILRARAIPATFFVTSSLRIVTTEPHVGLTPIAAEEVHALAEQGFEIGSHGHTHTPFPDCSVDQLQEECVESQRILSSVCGKPIRRLSYPKNRPNVAAIPILKTAGYVSAYDGYGTVSARTSAWEMPRLTVTGDLPLWRLRCRMYAACAFARP